MQPKTALILAAAITSFVLVFAGGVLSRVTSVPSAIQTSQLSVSALQALDVARASGANTALRQPELVNFRGKVAYEVVSSEGTIYIDSGTGAVLASSIVGSSGGSAGGPGVMTTVAPKLITSSDAMHVAAQYLPGERPLSAEIEREHGVTTYEVKFASGSEVMVDAQTGDVVYAQVRQSGSKQRGERRDD